MMSQRHKKSGRTQCNLQPMQRPIAIKQRLLLAYPPCKDPCSYVDAMSEILFAYDLI